jgi:hypothetical protein
VVGFPRCELLAFDVELKQDLGLNPMSGIPTVSFGQAKTFRPPSEHASSFVANPKEAFERTFGPTNLITDLGDRVQLEEDLGWRIKSRPMVVFIYGSRCNSSI